MSVELARYRCPRCRLTFDVWLEDGRPEGGTKATVCHTCLDAGYLVRGRPDAEETALYGDDP